MKVVTEILLNPGESISISKRRVGIVNRAWANDNQ